MPQKLLPSRLLIQRRSACLEAIRRHYADFGCSPTFAELAARIGVEAHHVGGLVRDLAARGLIGWRPGIRKSITLPDPADMLSNSEHIIRLQRRGVIVWIAPEGASPVASAWPEASLIDVSDGVAKVEHDLIAKLDDIP